MPPRSGAAKGSAAPLRRRRRLHAIWFGAGPPGTYTGRARSLGPLPDLPLERVVVADPGLGVRVPFHLGLELERLLDEPGRALVGVLDGLRVGVAVERVRAPVVEDDLAGRRVGLGDAPVLPRAELEPTAGFGRVTDLVGRPDQDPGADQVLGEFGRLRVLLGWLVTGLADREHDGRHQEDGRHPDGATRR